MKHKAADLNVLIIKRSVALDSESFMILQNNIKKIEYER